jgi:PhzF family phenazine biosynthesis protein
MVRRFSELDVFAQEPYRGNPLVVVHDAEGIAEEQLQAFAAWTNISETAFLLPPRSVDADYRVRIFTPTRELPFAGHPTLGSCRAWLEAGGIPRDEERVVQDCEIGLVEVRSGPAGLLSFAAPPLLRSGPVDDQLLEQVESALGLPRAAVVDASWVDNGPGWLGLQLASSADLASVAVPELDLAVGVVGLCPPGSRFAYELRAFIPEGARVVEDPVTGSLHASIAQWLIGRGVVSPPYVAAQGASLGRAGEVSVDVDDDGSLWVGGVTTVRITGSVDL